MDTEKELIFNNINEKERFFIKYGNFGENSEFQQVGDAASPSEWTSLHYPNRTQMAFTALFFFLLLD